VARRILGEEVTQIEYYTERVKRMVGKVLTGNGITRYERGTYDLVGGEELSDVEREELLKLCRQRLDAFREQRGEEVFAHRSRHRTPISGSIKVRAWGRWVDVAPAGMECGGGCGPSIPKQDQVGWNGSMECSTPPKPAWPASDHDWPASSARSLR